MFKLSIMPLVHQLIPSQVGTVTFILPSIVSIRLTKSTRKSSNNHSIEPSCRGWKVNTCAQGSPRDYD